ncbi:MAG: bifunctional pyr operon transcriptional regulator/uracil phosphoribosyltransferase PyrR [Candidatus Omnitrophica bacterium]|nr:bifunctional pyr operon transcriptional regulator/uracil phosphoribosyltransferase PyrR [Candidatus Omnitrophota bacterium]
MNFKEKSRILDKDSMEKTLERLAHEIIERSDDMGKVALVGIKNRGAYLAGRIADKITRMTSKRPLVGALDITLYRDDLTQAWEQPVVHATEIDFDINGLKIILVDDVLYTGRTVRCALDALIDYGRPGCIELAVLVDRGHRELPIRADYVGKNVPTAKDETVEVRLVECDGKDEVALCEREK